MRGAKRGSRKGEHDYGVGSSAPGCPELQLTRKVRLRKHKMTEQTIFADLRLARQVPQASVAQVSCLLLSQVFNG